MFCGFKVPVMKMRPRRASQTGLQPETDRSPKAAIMGEIKSLLKQGREYSVVHVNCSCNNVAHRLAQIGHHHMHRQFGPNEIGLLHEHDCNPQG